MVHFSAKSVFFGEVQQLSNTCQSVEDDRSAVSNGQLWSFCCCGPIDLGVAARQSSWPSSES